MLACKILLLSPSQRSLWQSVNKATKGERCLIVLEEDVPPCFNIFCPDAQRYCSRVGGAGQCVWQGCCRCRVMGHYSRTIDFITVPLTYPSLTLSKCPCQPLIHLIPWLSILMAFGQKGQYFCGVYLNVTAFTQKKKLPSSRKCREDGNMMYCNHMLPVGFIKFSLFTHSQAYFKCTHRKVCISTHKDREGARRRHTPTSDTHTRSRSLCSFPSPWWNRGCHAVTACGRRANKCFPPRRGNLNGKTTWQLCHIIKHHTHSYTAQLLFRGFSVSASCSGNIHFQEKCVRGSVCQPQRWISWSFMERKQHWGLWGSALHL